MSTKKEPTKGTKKAAPYTSTEKEREALRKSGLAAMKKAGFKPDQIKEYIAYLDKKQGY